ncbi:hypothetical protein SAMN05428969_1356 [Devosia sp. YR412]|uniref:hypothetical protein n=1 Tax=Devosia sp. YR412 TaxID=1881030 RepID=UPI0008B6AE6B|nr:hypothetical protein [Devosia sp. YR412]SEP97331.1 hypothetical protein SAMN05428969_1356 [Devosia sp. YR412]
MSLAIRFAIAATVLLAFIIQMVGGLNADASWLLTVSERMLAGQQLYVDIYELNPPMSAMLYVPIVVLAQAVGLAAEPILVAAVLLSALLSVAFSTRVLRRAQLLSNTSEWWLISMVALSILPGSNFAEREHIAVILLLPLLAISALRSTGRAPQPFEILTAGLAAGLAMTIKPHFALPILLVASYSAIMGRSWRAIFNPEHVLSGLILVAYWLMVWIWFSSFFTTMLPIASSAYLADRAPILLLLFGPQVWLILLILAGLLLLYRRQMLVPPNGQYLAAALGFFLVYLIQGKGFVYHLLPVQLLISLVFAQSFLTKSARGRVGIIPLTLAVFIIAAPGLQAIQGNSLRKEAFALLAPLGPGLTIANITPQLEIATPLHRDLRATLVNSGPCLWIGLGALRRGMSTTDPLVVEEMAELETYERGRLRDDLLANPPDIILGNADMFDWLGWASDDAAIAILLGNYELLAEIGPPDMPLKILRRKPS